MQSKQSEPTVAEMNSVLNRTTSLLNLLIKDANIALKEAKEANDELKPYRRRILVRALFALFEGQCFCHRNLMLTCAQLLDYKFSDDEILKLKELKEVDDPKTGKRKQIKNWLKTEESLKISFEWTAKFVGTEFKLDTKSDGYQALLETKQIRDDLMHPKKTSSLVIGDLQFGRIEKALEWFHGEYERYNQEVSGIRSGDLVRSFARPLRPN